MASKRKPSESVYDKSNVQKHNENMEIVEEEDKNKNEEEKEINDEDGDNEETENDTKDEEEGDHNESEEGYEDVVKTFNIDKFQVEMPIDDPTNLTSDFVVKSAMDAKFDAFRMILMDEKLDDFFKSSYFGYFLDLSERKIKYKGDDDEALENKNKKMDEI
ncbi:hypothetical protein H5410_023332 [Solanum commersonii]|uniref:Uncharacterized protein n=1 Tax=Solanum commersonii TaxID=4109 RepID=A0A9J5ZGJ7_SOLCO|nr:hypothetical protein H5410_023332 [Solanum commersonii]